MKSSNHIRITRKKFGQSNSLMILLFYIVFSIMGLIGVVLDWRNGLAAIIFLSSIYVIQKFWSIKYLWWIIAMTFIALCVSAKFLDIDVVWVVANSLFLCFGFLIPISFQSYKENGDFDVFYWDNKQLKCLVIPKNSRPKDYALDPKSHLQVFHTGQLKSIRIVRNSLTFTIEDSVVRPMELNNEEVQVVMDFAKEHFPNLLIDDGSYQANLRKENNYYIRKMLLYFPVIILAIIIYFFADNGRNRPLTYLCISLMIVIPLVIHLLSKKKSA